MGDHVSEDKTTSGTSTVSSVVAFWSPVRCGVFDRSKEEEDAKPSCAARGDRTSASFLTGLVLERRAERAPVLGAGVDEERSGGAGRSWGFEGREKP